MDDGKGDLAAEQERNTKNFPFPNERRRRSVFVRTVRVAHRMLKVSDCADAVSFRADSE